MGKQHAGNLGPRAESARKILVMNNHCVIDRIFYWEATFPKK